MNRKKGIVLIVWSISALALGLVSIITADWIHTTDGTIYVGLWKRCDKGDCTNYDGKEQSVLKAIQALHIFACILLAAAIVVCIYVTIRKDDFEDDHKAISSIFFLSGVSFIVAMLLFTTNYKPCSECIYGYSFILGWTACGMSSVGAIALR